MSRKSRLLLVVIAILLAVQLVSLRSTSIEFYILLLIVPAVVIVLASRLTRGRHGAGRVRVTTMVVMPFATFAIFDSPLSAIPIAVLLGAATFIGILVNHRLRREGDVGYIRW